jgi:hypothetical protein
MPAHGNPNVPLGWLAFLGGLGLFALIADWLN